MHDEADTTAIGTVRRRVVEWSDPRQLLQAGRGMSGLDLLQTIAAGDLPPPPMTMLTGIELVSAEPGRVTMRMQPGEYLYNPLGSIHGGAIATLLDSVMGCAVHSNLPIRRGYTTLELKVNYLRSVTISSGPITAVGSVVHDGRRQAVAEGKAVDCAGRLCAISTTTCLLFELPDARPSPIDDHTAGPS